jgi:hypothetical protein
LRGNELVMTGYRKGVRPAASVRGWNVTVRCGGLRCHAHALCPEYRAATNHRTTPVARSTARPTNPSIRTARFSSCRYANVLDAGEPRCGLAPRPNLLGGPMPSGIHHRSHTPIGQICLPQRNVLRCARQSITVVIDRAVQCDARTGCVARQVRGFAHICRLVTLCIKMLGAAGNCTLTISRGIDGWRVGA